MGQKGRFRIIWGLKKGVICPSNSFLRTLRGAPKVQKWVSDANPVNIGELDHYVVFGTKSGVIQGFQRGQKCFIEVKQNLVDPPTPTKTPSKTPKTQYLTLPIANLIPL